MIVPTYHYDVRFLAGYPNCLTGWPEKRQEQETHAIDRIRESLPDDVGLSLYHDGQLSAFYNKAGGFFTPDYLNKIRAIFVNGESEAGKFFVSGNKTIYGMNIDF